MSEETTTTTVVEDPAAVTTTVETDVEKQAFLERLNKESGKRKEAEERAQTIEKQLADLKAQMDEREQAGLPELDRERKRAEQLEKRAAEAEERAAQAEQSVQRGQRERWVTAAAAAQNFADPSDAPPFVSLDDIEDEKDAERAVKALANRKKHFLKNEDPELPGRVLENGREQQTVTGKKGNIDLDAEAKMLADELKKYVR